MVIFITLNFPWNDSKLLQYDINYHGILIPRKVGFFTAVIYMKNYRNSFITLAPCGQNYYLF
jgi:hypothetical protein